MGETGSKLDSAAQCTQHAHIAGHSFIPEQQFHFLKQTLSLFTLPQTLRNNDGASMRDTMCLTLVAGTVEGGVSPMA